MLRTLASGQIPAPPTRFTARTLLAAFAAVAEGLAASRQYQQSRTRGCSHDAAIHEAFGILPARQRGGGAVCFAGKA
jgi:hypothetical protein